MLKLKFMNSNSSFIGHLPCAIALYMKILLCPHYNKESSNLSILLDKKTEVQRN
jgi:hypothetical protein